MNLRIKIENEPDIYIRGIDNITDLGDHFVITSEKEPVFCVMKSHLVFMGRVDETA